MKNRSLNDIFEEAYRREFSEFDNAPQHKFSFSHKRKMKKIFALYSDSQTQPDTAVRKPAKRLSVALILAAVLASTAITITASGVYNGFAQKEYTNYTNLLAVDYESGPSAIEYIYEPDLSENYEIVSHDMNTVRCWTDIEDHTTGKIISIEQSVKKEYAGHYDNNHSTYTTVYISEIPALYIETEYETGNYGTLVWDNGDYILELSGYVTQNELTELAGSLKIKKL